MLGVDFDDVDNETHDSSDQKVVDAGYKNEARDGLDQSVESTTILNHLFVNDIEEVK